ncbi:DsrH/TusB family sulfur relay protein [Methylomonas methanica]|uniref:Sulfur relay protein TusB/DsrH n=1 Tax=Methylomonas methanica (strain DSM 25384 / MC09) TaxID=857087 RepID=G0A3D9_METMM|nr:DsrH/TusB family sulfur metabolism protein [Methylomonas methanica]AEG00238.1 sulfur relay protein TusB/DsrH [Methylomonas methanica MC09]
MLHLVAESTLTSALVARTAKADDVVLQAGAVWAAFSGHKDNAKLSGLLDKGCHIYALSDVLAMNGILDQQLLTGVIPIDYAQFVELTVKNPVIHTWC